jgi:hypothetical protein
VSIPGEWSLALIGNASGKDHGTEEERNPRHFR